MNSQKYKDVDLLFHINMVDNHFENLKSESGVGPICFTLGRNSWMKCRDHIVESMSNKFSDDQEKDVSA
jgi:hypothetical protein